jgi:hypothetical protein
MNQEQIKQMTDSSKLRILDLKQDILDIVKYIESETKYEDYVSAMKKVSVLVDKLSEVNQQQQFLNGVRWTFQATQKEV